MNYRHSPLFSAFVPVAVLAILLTTTSCGLYGGDYPSLAQRPGESARSIQPAETPHMPTLSEEEQKLVEDGLTSEKRNLDLAMQDINRAELSLSRALSQVTTGAAGTAAWATAQMEVSRFDIARQSLTSIDARLVPLLLLVDDLPESDDRRIRLYQLTDEIRAQSDASERTLAAALRKLG